MIFVSVQPMSSQQGFYLPTKFALKTALDKITATNICRTLTYVGGILMFMRASVLWAKAETPFPDSIVPMPSKEDRIFIKNGRKKAAFRYLLSGCALTAAGLVQSYGSTFLSQLPRFKQTLFGS